MRWAMLWAAGLAAAVLLAVTAAAAGQPSVASGATGHDATGSGGVVRADATAKNLVYLPLLTKNGDVALSSVPPSITLGLSSTGVKTGGAITLTWRVDGQTENDAFLLRAREPGPQYTSTGELLMPGMPLATGSAYYLKPDLTWTQTDTVFLSPFVSSSIAVTLPTGSEGEWRLEAVLRNNGTGETEAFDARSLLA